MTQDEQIQLLEVTIMTSQNLLDEIKKASSQDEPEGKSLIQQALETTKAYNEKMNQLKSK